MKFTIALCTRNRPQMLTTCINSIKSLEIPPNCKLHLVIVENNETPDCKHLVQDLMKSSPQIGYTYCLEERLGLSMARNTSLESAIMSNPDWICFLDDDQFVERDWLISYHNIIQTNLADVYSGTVNYVLPNDIQPEDLPVWFKFPFSNYEYQNLIIQESAGTGNTIAKASYFNGQPYEFRFDEKHQFTGAEDFELFKRISNSGGIIRHYSEAVANEIIALERISIKWMIKKEFSNGNLTGSGRAIRYGNWSTSLYWFKTLYLIREAIKRSFAGTLFLIWGIVIWPFSPRSIRYIVKGIRKIFWAFGLFLGFARIRFKLYKITEGN